MLQAKADSKGQPAFLSFQALDRIMSNLGGESFDYEGFKNVYDSNPALKDLVKNFNEKGVTVKTKEQPSDANQADTAQGDTTVSTMAKRATDVGAKL
jgi:hypothetical protein